MLPRLKLLFFFSLLIPLLKSNAQSVTDVGQDNTLEIATWNIEWFGSSSNGPTDDQLQIDNARAIILGSDIDLWGVQEIADIGDFNALLEALGSDYDGKLATNSGEQRIGVIYNVNVIVVKQVKHILEDFSNAFASRPPLQLNVDVVLPDTTVDLTLIVVHMKAFSDNESYERRVDASQRIKNHIDFTALEDQRVIVLGDMNDELEQSTSGGKTSPYENFKLDPENYALLTLPLEASGAGSFCANLFCTSTGSMLDHLFITNEIFDSYLDNSAGFIPNLPNDISPFNNSTSDHLPVFARFDFGQTSGVATEQLPNQSELVTLHAPFPNPFSNSTSLSVTLAATNHLKIEVFDLLGRRVVTLVDRLAPAGTYQHTFDPGPAPPGIYMLRVSTDELVKSVPVTFLR